MPIAPPATDGKPREQTSVRVEASLLTWAREQGISPSQTLEQALARAKKAADRAAAAGAAAQRRESRRLEKLQRREGSGRGFVQH